MRAGEELILEAEALTAIGDNAAIDAFVESLSDDEFANCIAGNFDDDSYCCQTDGLDNY